MVNHKEECEQVIIVSLNDELKEAWTVKEAAKHLGYSERHTRYLCESEILFSIKHQGRWLIFVDFL